MLDECGLMAVSPFEFTFRSVFCPNVPSVYSRCEIEK